MRARLWLVAGVLTSAVFVRAATTPFTFAGAVDVAGRRYRGEVARPVQTLIWYPAQKSARPTVRFGDYLALFATEDNFWPTPDASALPVHQ